MKLHPASRSSINSTRARRIFPALLIAAACALSAAGLGGAYAARGDRQSKSEVSAQANAAGIDVRPLAENVPIEREIQGGERHSYSFRLPPNRYAHAVVDQRGIDLEVLILDEGDNTVAEIDRQSGSRGPEAISLITKEGGAFRLEVRPVSKGAPKGVYRVEITEVRAPAGHDEVRVQAERVTNEAGRLYTKAGAQSSKEFYRESIRKFEQAIKLWSSLGEPYEEAVALYGMGWSYSDLGAYGMIKFPIPIYRLRWSYETREDHQKAIGYFKQALDYFLAADDLHGQAITYTGLAWPSLYQGNSKEALDYFSKALPLHRSFGNLRGEAFALYGIGWAHALSGESQMALDNFLQSLPLRQSVKDRRGEAITLAGICRMYGRLGKSTQALEFCDRALPLFKVLKDNHGVASTHNAKGWSYYSLGRHEEARALFEQVLEMRKAAGDVTGQANALYGLGKVNTDQGDLKAALEKMDAVFKLIDPLRARGGSEELRTYYFANVQEYYDFYIELLMRAHRLRPQGEYARTALIVKERARARELLAILAEVVSNVGEDVNLEAARPLEVADIQQSLGSDTLLLEYAATEKRTYVWAVTESTLEGFELPAGTAEVQRAANALVGMLKETGGTVREFEAAAAVLSRMLLPPKAAAHLRHKKRVVIVADDVLHYVPFTTLSLPGRQGAYVPLVFNHEVVNLPSVATLRVVRQKMAARTPAPNAVAVLADPVFRSGDARVKRDSFMPAAAESPAADSSPDRVALSDMTDEDIARIFFLRDWNAVSKLKFKRLPGTREEAEIIRELEPSARVELDFDVNLKNATDAGLGQFRIIHFATHGIALDNNPELSGLVLSMVDERGRPQREGWYLDLASVCRLNLPVELVVLSACDTSVGKNVRGEGLIGLTRGFMYAGAPRVVASLWEVREKATKELMRRFYTSVLREGERPSAALSAAQAAMWKERRWAPSDWASFVYSGEWR